MKQTNRLLAVPMLLGVTASLASATLISVDLVYSDLNGGPSSPYSGDTIGTGTLNINVAGEVYTGQVGPWNALDTGSNNGNNTSASLGSLVDGTGNLTTVSITMGTATTSGSGMWRNGYVGTVGGNLREEQAYIYYPGITATNYYDWELAGLTANAHYRLTLFGDGGASYTNIANSMAGVLDSEGDWNWVDITASPTGFITGQFATSGNNDIHLLYGLQLETIAVPEPSSIALLGLTSLGLIRRRRRN